MPRDVVALVSADDVVAAIRVHADRVHDLLRRSGCGEAESVEVCESYALAMIDAIVNAPETVGDMAGWWFARSLELGRRLGNASAETPAATRSLLAGTTGEWEVRGALDGLPQRERDAVLLRDGYDLPPEAVAIALATDVDSAASLVAMGRMQLLARYTGRGVPEAVHHGARMPADLPTLGRVADGSAPMPRSVAIRRHLGGCVGCEEVVDAQAKARRLVAALPIIAMPDDAREAMLARVAERAYAVLPSVDEVLIAVEQDDDSDERMSPIIAAVAIALALVLGIAVAVVTTRSPTGGFAPVSEGPSDAAAPKPSFAVSHQHRRNTKSPTPRPTSTRATTSPTPTQSRTASPRPTTTRSSRPPPAAATISISPTRGPRGTVITVTGAGWKPGSVVQLRYTGTLTSDSSSTSVAKDGTFSGTVRASGTLPGSYTVSASNGPQSTATSFQQTT